MNGVTRRLLRAYDEDYVPFTRTFRYTFRPNYVPPIQLNVGEFLRRILMPSVESPRVIIRMAYERSLLQLNQGDHPISYQRHNFYLHTFDSPQTAIVLDEMLERFMQSNDEFEWENLVITVVNGTDEVLRGAGSDNEDLLKPLTVQEAGIVIVPRNAQNLCGYIAVLCHFKKFQPTLKNDQDLQQVYEILDKFSKSFRFDRWAQIMIKGMKLINCAKELQTMLGGQYVGRDDQFALYKHGRLFVQKFPKFRIVIIDINCRVLGDVCGQEYMALHAENVAGEVVGDAHDYMHEYCIAMLFKDGHYDLIQNLSAYYRMRYDRERRWFFCNVCLKPFYKRNNLYEHQCIYSRCEHCNKPFESDESLKQHIDRGKVIQCSNCEQEFMGDECFTYHARQCGSSTARNRCNQCYKLYLDLENHNCNAAQNKKCLFCGKKVTDYQQHRCRPYIQKLEMPETCLGPEKIWAFDIECTTIRKNEKDVHVPNLIMARCLADDRMFKFDTVDEFMVFLCEIPESVMFFAHNFGGYDGRVLFKYFVRHSHLKMVNAIPNGSKFMAYTFTNGNEELDEQGNPRPVLLKFRDSFRHMSQSLRSLPKTYGLNQELFAKGFYPHSFNKPENRFYRGPLPAKELFHPDEMKDDEKMDFEKWYNEQEIAQEIHRLQTGRNDYYDHYLEFVKYCESDVNVLAEALLVYMKEYMAQCKGLNPLERVTIASHCMRHYLTNHLEEDTIPQLKPLEFKYAKEAFFGGRTHPCSLLVENDKIGYVDVNSLYPAVMVNCPLPKGDLKYVVVNRQLSKEEILQMHGILEVDIKPTKYLHHPIFPVRDPETFTNTYPLTALEKIKRTSIEIHKALDHGYEVDFVYTALLTDVSYDLFKSYIYEAQTAKLLASGVPKEFETIEGKQRFIEEYKQEIGVDLTAMKFEKNPGKRATAKLTNNSLWGKFGENTTRVKMSKYELVKDGIVQSEEATKYNALMNEIFDGKQTFCQNFTYTHDDGQVCYMFTREINDGYNQDLKDCTNVMLCAFVTANARMVLWDALNFLGDRVLYCDTDSVIYLLDDNAEMNIKSSSKLGEWKDECEGEHITDFVSIAPKSYAYKMSNGETVVKCKGVTLNYENAKRVTFEDMKALVTGDREKLVTRHLMFDCSKANEFEINTVYREKATSLNKNMLKGELLMKQNEWRLAIPRDYMIFPHGYEEFIEDLKQLYPQKRVRGN